MSGNATDCPSRQAPHIPSAEAARMLGVPPEALEQWARQFEFPTQAGPSGPSSFARDEIEALRATLAASHSVEGAIREARRRLRRDA